MLLVEFRICYFARSVEYISQLGKSWELERFSSVQGNMHTEEKEVTNKQYRS